MVIDNSTDRNRLFKGLVVAGLKLLDGGFRLRAILVIDAVWVAVPTVNLGNPGEHELVIFDFVLALADRDPGIALSEDGVQNSLGPLERDGKVILIGAGRIGMPRKKHGLLQIRILMFQTLGKDGKP